MPKPHNFRDQAIDIEDDETLEGLGFAAGTEVTFLNTALNRIEAKTDGICQESGDAISDARLMVVPAALLYKKIAHAGAH